MKTNRWMTLVLLVALLSGFSVVGRADGTNEDFSAIGKAVVRLLQSGDAASFAAEMAPTSNDWLAVLSTNVTAFQTDPAGRAKSMAVYQRQRIEQAARQLLAKATVLRV